MKKPFFGYIKVLLCVFIACCMIFLSSCSASPESIALTQKTSDIKLNDEKVNKKLFSQTKTIKQLQKISRSDMTVLYFDEESKSVSVYDYASKKLWNSLPEKYTDEAPCTLSVDVLVGSNLYTLDSQTHSVNKGLAAEEVKDNGITVTYGFDSSLSDGTKIKLSIPVYFEAVNGVFSASVDCSKIVVEGSKVKIKTLHLLEYFGSSVDAQAGDNIIVPDGCGAKINLEEKAKEFEKIVLPVYGEDPSSNKEVGSAGACVAAYAVRSGDSAFSAVIENGESIATVTAQKALSKSSYNKVGASFELLGTYSDGERLYVSKRSYDAQIKITYRLLSGDNAGYVGMASACRETLIRNGTLSFRELSEETNSYPLVLTLIGSADIGEEKKKKTVLTDFEEAQEILSFLRSKGISNILLRYKGIFDGGLSQTDAKKLKLNSSLGTKKGFNDLLNYTSSQNIDFFADVGIISAASGKSSVSAVSANGEPVSEKVTLLNNKAVKCEGEVVFAGVSELSESVNNVIGLSRELNFSGVCICDAGRFLYTDYSSKAYSDRQQTRDSIFSHCASISSSKKLMISGANIYAVKYADCVSDLPMTSSVDKREYCSSVPFLQAILHGVVPYSGSPMNLSSNTDTALLKAAEYGCLPSCELYYENLGTQDNADSYHYMNYASDAQTSYERLLNTFSDLENKKITAHYTVKSGVVCTEYGGNISVYVNYNKKDVKVNGVTVEARSFLRVG